LVDIMGANWVLLPIFGERIYPIHRAGFNHQQSAMLGMSLLMACRGLGAIIGPVVSGYWAAGIQRRMRLGILFGYLAGAAGYLLKAGSPGELIRGIVAVAEGKAALHSSVTQYLVDEIAGVGEAQEQDKRLSRREHDVLQLMAHGLSTKQIAAELGITIQTVKTHTSRLYARMGTRDRTETVASAIRKGLVT